MTITFISDIGSHHTQQEVGGDAQLLPHLQGGGGGGHVGCQTFSSSRGSLNSSITRIETE